MHSTHSTPAPLSPLPTPRSPLPPLPAQTIKKTINPTWEEEFEWQGKKRDLFVAPLALNVFDEDRLASDDPLGNVTLPPTVCNQPPNVPMSAVVPLSTHGTIKLRHFW